MMGWMYDLGLEVSGFHNNVTCVLDATTNCGFFVSYDHWIVITRFAAATQHAQLGLRSAFAQSLNQCWPCAMGIAVEPTQRTCKAEGGVEETGKGKGEKKAGAVEEEGTCWGKGY